MRVLEKPERSHPKQPTVDEVEFRSLYVKTRYVVETADGWGLVITRYRPRPQPFHQPLFGEPLLLVHGFSQNRHTWTSGEFVKNLLYFGLDIHVLELRGHGQSSIDFQRMRAARFNRPLPPDLEYGWDIDSYFLYDLPAGIAGVKRVSRRERIFLCGHSMGGILGYGYAGIHSDLEGLITIGAPADLGRGYFALRILARTGPFLSAMIDGTLQAINVERYVTHRVEQLGARLLRRFVKERGSGDEPPEDLRYEFVPIDRWLKFVARVVEQAESNPRFEPLISRVWLANPDRVSFADILWLLREGGEREPRKVVEQFARWIRNRELVCYRTGYDFKRGFSKITIPMAIIFGDMDPLASVESTRSVYRAAKSEYLLWRPVKGNSHIELTMGHDIRQICYDVKNLIEYARTHRERGPLLPRVR